MLDRYWFGEVDRISPEAPVPVVRVRTCEERLAGAANVARNMSALGAHVALLGVVGQDEAGLAVDRLLKETGITAHLHVDTSLPTTVKVRVIGRQQQIVRADFESRPEGDVLLANLNAFTALLPEYGLVVLSDYGKGGLTITARLIELAPAAGRQVLVDPKGDEYSRYAGATFVTPNRGELREVVGRWTSEDDLEKRTQRLRKELNFSAVLLTRSEEGMTLFTHEGSWTVPAQTREVYDVSGTGDTVVAVLGVALAAGLPLRQAVELANRAGGIVVGKLGTVTVSHEELFRSVP